MQEVQNLVRLTTGSAFSSHGSSDTLESMRSETVPAQWAPHWSLRVIAHRLKYPEVLSLDLLMTVESTVQWSGVVTVPQAGHPGFSPVQSK